MWLFVLFIAVPLIEIALFIQVGGAIGLWATLAIVVITALIGTNMMRAQGAAAMRDIKGSFNDMRDPSEPLAHGAMILFSGALLLTPRVFHGHGRVFVADPRVSARGVSMAEIADQGADV